ncbi:transglutaminase domain-containing protein [Clostridium tyrobutyricum]|uniref:transglutaminase domain-containing protein n=1 Tax=Clostridium tyrobutyricum TaxID=1519 RepID=UPI00057EC7A6|nr:transglutaminase domain-containing protein [Clostridium tyrobutyricum]
MLKKIRHINLIFFTALFIFIGQTVYAEGNSSLWNNGAISKVSDDKVWTITFNRPVDINDASNYIKVYETEDDKNVDINISEKDKNTIIVSAKDQYKNGQNYVLDVSDDLKDIYGNKLNKSVKYNFSIDNDNCININSYNDYYNILKNALEDYRSQLVLNIQDYDSKSYDLNVINNIMNDYPELRLGYESATGTIEYSNPVKMTINFKYSDTKQNLIQKNNVLNKKVQDIVNGVTNSSMKDYQKELALHDYVVNNAKYDQRDENGGIPDDSYNAYGILIDGVGVCQGYADAMYRLLKAAGIENIMVIGQANNGSGLIGHAWNIVKIQGKYYNLDSTWDDPVTDNGTNVLSHLYFNITDKQLSVDHKWNESNYPSCNSTDYSYSKIASLQKNIKSTIK